MSADEWPPLLHPGMLADLEAYSAWERHMVARCADEALSPESVIATLERDSAGHAGDAVSATRRIAGAGGDLGRLEDDLLRLDELACCPKRKREVVAGVDRDLWKDVAVCLRPDAAGPRDRLLHVSREPQGRSDEQRRRQIRLQLRPMEGRLALLGGP